MFALPFWSLYIFSWESVRFRNIKAERSRYLTRVRKASRQVEKSHVNLKRVCQAELSMPRELSENTLSFVPFCVVFMSVCGVSASFLRVFFCPTFFAKNRDHLN